MRFQRPRSSAVVVGRVPPLLLATLRYVLSALHYAPTAEPTGRLIVAGIRTEQCCETTARVGSDLGYAVDFVSEATLTFPMTHAGTGQTFSAQDITTRTELVLANRFARIVNVDTCLSSL